MLLPSQPKTDALYKYSMVKNQHTAVCWYINKLDGINVLSKTVSHLMKEGGFSGRYTNHSLRVSAATRMFQSGIEEQIVKEKTGHRSEAVHAYKHTNESLLVNAEEAKKHNWFQSVKTCAWQIRHRPRISGNSACQTCRQPTSLYM